MLVGHNDHHKDIYPRISKENNPIFDQRGSISLENNRITIQNFSWHQCNKACKNTGQENYMFRFHPFLLLTLPLRTNRHWFGDRTVSHLYVSATCLSGVCSFNPVSRNLRNRKHLHPGVGM